MSSSPLDTFGSVLTWHMTVGTRPSGKNEYWTIKEFASAMDTVENTVRNWRKDRNLPPDCVRIENALFGEDPHKNDDTYREWRERLQYLFKLAKKTKPQDVPQTRYDRYVDSTEQLSESVQADHGKPMVQDKLPVSNISILVPEHFLGRKVAMDEIDGALSKTKNSAVITTLHGMRGVGKTILAAAYAQQRSSDYHVRWWIKAETESSLRADLRGLGIRLGWIRHNSDEATAIKTVMERLQFEGEGILLIYDNAQNANDLMPYLPSGGAARIIITSNNHAWRRVAELVKIDVWSKATGGQFLLARCGQHDSMRSEAEALSEVLGGLPLALEMAGAYCERIGISFTEYQRRFEMSPARRLDDEHDTPAEYDKKTVAQTFALAIEEATKLHAAAEPLIVHMALLGGHVPLYVFATDSTELEEPLATSLDSESLDEAVAALRAFALVDRKPHEYGPSDAMYDEIDMHRLVRIVAFGRRDGTARDTIMRALTHTVAAVYPKHIFNGRRSTFIFAQLDMIALALVEQVAPKSDEDSICKLLNGLASYRVSFRSRLAEALPFLERILVIQEQVYGAKHPQLTRSLNNLGNVLADMGELPAARELFKRALANQEDRADSEDPDIVLAQYNLLFVVEGLPEYDNADLFKLRAALIHHKPAHNSYDMVMDLFVLAVRLQIYRRNFSGALLLFERVLSIAEHHISLHIFKSICACLRRNRDRASTRDLRERIPIMCEKALGIRDLKC